MTYKDFIQKVDKALLLAVISMLGVGLVQVYSSSFIFAIETYGDGLFFFKKQLIFSLMGVLALLAGLFIPLDWIRKHATVLWCVGAVLLVSTLVPGVGHRAGGAARWIQLPFGFRFEPGELLKLGVSGLIASFIANAQVSLKTWSIRCGLILVPCLILLKQPDFGTLSIICAVVFTFLFAYGLPLRFVALLVSVAAPVFYFLVMTVPYRRARVLAFLDPWADPEKTGFQVIQSLLSFHSGGFTGVGLGQGQGKLFFLPEAHTDFTLAVLGEEMGLIGFAALLLMYFFMIYRGFQLSLRSTDDVFVRAFSLGLITTFALSVIINMGVVLGMFPTKGLALPFLSYGGSSLVMTCFLFGLLLNCDIQVQGHHSSRRVFFSLIRS